MVTRLLTVWVRDTGSRLVSTDPRVPELVCISGANTVLIIVFSPHSDLTPVGYSPVCGMAGALSWASLGLSTRLRSMSFHVVLRLVDLRLRPSRLPNGLIGSYTPGGRTSDECR